MRFVRITAIISAAILSVIPAHAQVANEAEAVEKIAAWCAGLTSFDGAYQWRQVIYTGADSPPGEKRIEYRFEGGNRWLRFPDKDGSTITEALFDGLVSNRLDRSVPAKEAPAGELNINAPTGWRWDLFPFLLPDDAIKRPYFEIDVASEIRTGQNFLIEREGKQVLSHWTVPGASQFGGDLDVYFDSEGRVESFRWLTRFGYESPQAMEAALPELSAMVSPFDAHIVLQEDRYSRYQDYEGYWFPNSIERISFDMDSPPYAELKKLKVSGEISWKNYVERAVSIGKASQFGFARWTFQLDTDTSRINQPLSDSDFEVPVSAGSVVADLSTKQVYFVNQWDIFWSQFGPAMIIALLASAGLGIGAFLYRRHYFS